MAYTKIKFSSTGAKVKMSNIAGEVPALVDLEPQEMAVNIVDKKMYIHDGTAVVPIIAGVKFGAIYQVPNVFVASETGNLFVFTQNRTTTSIYIDNVQFASIDTWDKYGRSESVVTVPINAGELVAVYNPLKPSKFRPFVT